MRFKTTCFIFLLCIGGSIQKIEAQSLTGVTGLLFSPTADMQTDRTLIFGGSYFNKTYLAYTKNEHDAVAGYLNLTFLPFLEIGFRYTKRLYPVEDGNFADRMPSIRVRLLKEKKVLPAIVIGVHDLSSIDGGDARHFEASYLVATKTFKVGNFIENFKTSLGYGMKLFGANNHDAEGAFGGVEVKFKNLNWLSAMVEYDSKYWNAGIRMIFFKRLQVMPVLRNMETLEGNVTYKITL